MAEIKGIHGHDRPADPIRQRFAACQHADVAEVYHDSTVIELTKLDPHALPASVQVVDSTVESGSTRGIRRVCQQHGTRRGSVGALIEDVPVVVHRLVSG